MEKSSTRAWDDDADFQRTCSAARSLIGSLMETSQSKRREGKGQSMRKTLCQELEELEAKQ